jgi:hypothetical protein
MHGVFRSSLVRGMEVRDLAGACEVNRKLRACGEGLELLAVGANLAEALERRRELRREQKQEAGGAGEGDAAVNGGAGLDNAGSEGLT